MHPPAGLNTKESGESCMTDITPIVQGIFVVVFLAAAAFFIPWLRSKTSAAQQAEIQVWVNVAVLATEQLFGPGRGEEKKRWVIDQLAKRKVTLDLDALGVMIEAEVKKLFNWSK